MFTADSIISVISRQGLKLIVNNGQFGRYFALTEPFDNVAPAKDDDVQF